MGTSTDAHLCYGILLEEDTVETWDPEAIYEIIHLVNVCSRDNPIWLVAIADSYLVAHRGYPKIFNPIELAEKAILKWNIILMDFCAEHNILFAGVPQWYLSSFTD